MRPTARANRSMPRSSDLGVEHPNFFPVRFRRLDKLLMPRVLLVAAVLVNKVRAPDGAILVKEGAGVPAMLLLLMFCTPLAGMTTLFEMKMMAPVVFTLRLVNVFPLMFCVKVAAELMI